MKEMNKGNGPGIKLFGRKIVLPENGRISVSGEEFPPVDYDHCLEVNGGQKAGKNIEKEQHDEEDKNPCEADESQNPDSVSESNGNPKTPSIEEDVVSSNHPKTETDPSDATNHQKTLKKPDKILPCPRCNSMDTKFCYYNNYNISQPRHFCKGCQRYWTAGGTMRNVPVGAGRRKNKNTASHCSHITISEALQASLIDDPNEFNNSSFFKTNGTVLSFGPNSKSMVLTDKRENGDDCSIGSSITTLNSTENRGKNVIPHQFIPNINGFPSVVPCITGVPWSFPWNPTIPIPSIYPPGNFAMPLYPSPYWNLNLPWLSVPSNENSIGSNPKSFLGKHSRNGESLAPNNSDGNKHLEQENSESSIVVPKTLRIDDPEEAAKSSIWETLGIKYSREGLFKALQPKCDEKKSMVNASPLLQANPAALSRSISFQESS